MQSSIFPVLNGVLLHFYARLSLQHAVPCKFASRHATILVASALFAILNARRQCWSAQIRDEYESVKDMAPPEQAAAKRAAVANGAAPSLGGATEVTAAAEDTPAGRSSTARMLDSIAAERARCAACSPSTPGLYKLCYVWVSDNSCYGLRSKQVLLWPGVKDKCCYGFVPKQVVHYGKDIRQQAVHAMLH